MSDKFKENIKESTDLFKKYSDEYVDYNEYDFNNDDFVDPDHLNDKGAEKLSKLINYE